VEVGFVDPFLWEIQELPYLQYLFPTTVPQGTVSGFGTKPLATSPGNPNIIYTLQILDVPRFSSTGSDPFRFFSPRSATVPIVTDAFPFSHINAVINPPGSPVTVKQSGTTTPMWIELTPDPNKALTNSSGTVTITSPDVAASVGTVTLNYTLNTAPLPTITQWGLVNAAGFDQGGAVAPGEIFSLFGKQFGPSILQFGAPDGTGTYSTALANTQVFFDKTAAPLIYAGNGVVSGVAPSDLSGKTTTQLTVVSNGASSPPVTLQVVPATPGIFTIAATGIGPGAILNQNLTPNSPTNPAKPGDIVAIYGTGCGQTNPPIRDGKLAGVGAPLPTFLNGTSVTLDGVPVTNIPYAGPAPGLVEGVFQVNIQIPSNTRSGDLLLKVGCGTPPLPPGSASAVTLTVK
jgi:uncharacterized protein (TIGR03437 family)